MTDEIQKMILKASQPIIEEQNKKILEIFGMKFKMNNHIPNGEVFVIMDGKVIGKITGLTFNND